MTSAALQIGKSSYRSPKTTIRSGDKSLKASDIEIEHRPIDFAIPVAVEDESKNSTFLSI